MRSILSELYLYKDEQERNEAVERQVAAARQQLVALQETMKRFLAARVPAEYVEVCQRWRNFTVEKCGPLYTYFLDRVAKMREILRERRRRQLLIADPTLKEADVAKLLDQQFEVFSVAAAHNGLKPPQAPVHDELQLQLIGPAP